MAKKASTSRVFQIAKELGVSSKDIVSKCKAEGLDAITNHMSTVSVGLAATIREWFSEGGGVATAVETAEAVDIKKVRAKVKRKTSKETAKTDGKKKTDTPSTEPVITASEVTESTVKAKPELEATDIQELPVAKKKKPTRRKKATKKISEDDADTFTTAPKEVPAPTTPAPVMNVPSRPDVISPAGPMLQQPTKSKLSGPKVIRIETAEVIATPKPRGGREGAPPISRGGPRTGRGVGAMPSDISDVSMPARGGRGAGVRSSRRNKRRSASAFDESSRTTARSPSLAGEEQERPFNWREQDLLERENRLNRAGGFFKAARRDNLKRTTGGGQRAVVPADSGGKVKIETPITVKNLSAATGVKVPHILQKLLLSGQAVTVNSTLNADTATEVMLEYNIELEITEAKTVKDKIAEQFRTRDIVDEKRRSPVITILGHVDHGKTSLLDHIRSANVAEGEAGGITQATSAFQVPVHVGDAEHLITFIDTPGHEAFTEMRARGAQVTDVVVLVVAADDGVMPQTVESINHAKAAGVPIVVALNKMDKPEATDSNIQRILGQLAEHELNPAEWGGSTEVIKTSATEGTGVQDLLEVLDYQAQLLELTADFGGQAEGTVLEASVKEGRGPVASVLVQQGKLRKGDFVVVGRGYGRVRDIVNNHGKRIDEAGPSMPVAISGMNYVPDAGDKFYIVASLKNAEAAAAERITLERDRDLTREKVTLDNVFEHLSATGKSELPLIVKADVQGSVETLRTTLSKIASDDVAVSIKHFAVGGINDSDISLAEATGSIVVGFNVTASGSARRAAEDKSVDIRFYDVIYDLIDDIRKAAEGLLEPEVRLEVLGHAEVRQVFKISKVGMIAGCYVTDGVIERNSQIRVTRDGIVIEKDRRLQQLKRFKEDAKEVRSGQECGMNIDGYNDIKVGDVLECYRTREVKRTL